MEVESEAEREETGGKEEREEPAVVSEEPGEREEEETPADVMAETEGEEDEEEPDAAVAEASSLSTSSAKAIIPRSKSWRAAR